MKSKLKLIIVKCRGCGKSVKSVCGVDLCKSCADELRIERCED